MLGIIDAYRRDGQHYIWCLGAWQATTGSVSAIVGRTGSKCHAAHLTAWFSEPTAFVMLIGPHTIRAGNSSTEIQEKRGLQSVFPAKAARSLDVQFGDVEKCEGTICRCGILGGLSGGRIA